MPVRHSSLPSLSQRNRLTADACFRNLENLEDDIRKQTVCECSSALQENGRCRMSLSCEDCQFRVSPNQCHALSAPNGLKVDRASRISCKTACRSWLMVAIRTKRLFSQIALEFLQHRLKETPFSLRILTELEKTISLFERSSIL